MDLLNSLVKTWLDQIERAKKAKREKFGKTADRAWSFLGKNYRELYIDRSDGEESAFADGEGPLHKIHVNKSREFVSLFLPFLHNKVPNRLVTPDQPAIPPEMMGIPPGFPVPPQPRQQRDAAFCYLMQYFLNWLPRKAGLRDECRMTIPEALVKGRGLVWHEMVDGPAGPIPFSGFESVDNLLIDPDTRLLRDASYVVRVRHRNLWQVAEEFAEYGTPAEEIRDRYQAHFDRQRGNEDVGRPEVLKESDREGDRCTYYEVFSRMGVGQRFSGANDEMKGMAQALGEVGDYVWLAIMPGLPHPLNLSPALSGANPNELLTKIRAFLQWPIPFWADPFSPWPFTPLDFYPNQDNPWSTSPLEGALPLQAFLDHAYSFAMNHIKTASRSLVIASSRLDKAVLERLIDGVNNEVIIVDDDGVEEVRKLIEVLQFPPLNSDFYTILSGVERQFERASGMDPLLYGQVSQQMRSAREADVREAGVSSRPDDFAQCVELWQSSISAKEAGASRLHVGPATVAPVFGEQWDPNATVPGMAPLTEAWANLVNTDDPFRAFGEYEYTVEAGSGRRKNKQKQIADANMLMQTLSQPLLGYAQGTGNSLPFNALVRVVGEAYEVRLDDMMIPPAPPPQPQMAGPGGPEGQPAPEQGPPAMQ